MSERIGRMDFLRRTWVEVDLDRILNNYDRVRERVGDDCKVLCVVKANGYGHGAVQVARVLEKAGCDWLAVSNIEEAEQLREAGIELPILILGSTPPECVGTLAEYNITQAVYSKECAEQLSAAAKAAGITVSVHLKLDTGMRRIGFDATDAQEVAFAAEVCRMAGLKVSGVFTHFASADGDGDADGEFVKTQYTRFVDAIEAIERTGVHFSIRHCCNSAATLTHPEYKLDMVREGIVLYGLTPSEQVEIEGFLPAMSMKARVSMVKRVAAGESISYGRTYTADRDITVATVPVGYADGYIRAFSKGEVLVQGKRAKIVGRICMDQMMIDVTGIEVKTGDTVTLFGTDGQATLPVEELSDLADTINYETVCLIGRRVPRVYIQNGAEVHVSGLLGE